MHVLLTVVSFLAEHHQALARAVNSKMRNAVTETVTESVLSSNAYLFGPSNSMGGLRRCPKLSALLTWCGGKERIMRDIGERCNNVQFFIFPAEFCDVVEKAHFRRQWDAVTVDARHGGHIYRSFGAAKATCASTPSFGEVTRALAEDGLQYSLLPQTEISMPRDLCLQSVDLNGTCGVTSIAYETFCSSKTLTAVDLAEMRDLHKIGTHCFAGCSALSRVSLRGLAGLADMGRGTFAYCLSMTQIDLQGLTALQHIGDNCFWGCRSLQAVDLGGLSSLQSIRRGAFLECDSLETVVFGGLAHLISIELRAFQSCTSLKSIDMSGLASLSYIGDSAFFDCKGLTTCTLPAASTSQLKRISAHAFAGCCCLKSLVNFECLASLESIEEEAFCGCCCLSGLRFNRLGSLKRVGERAFIMCSALIIEDEDQAALSGKGISWCAASLRRIP